MLFLFRIELCYLFIILLIVKYLINKMDKLNNKIKFLSLLIFSLIFNIIFYEISLNSIIEGILAVMISDYIYDLYLLFK